MSYQLTIFGTGIICSHCKNDPGRDPKNPYLWNGFKDQDNKQNCCSNCKDHHYQVKALTDKKGMYSEFPLMVQPA